MGAVLPSLLLTARAGAEPPPAATRPSPSPKLASVIDTGRTVLVTDRSDIRYTPDLTAA